MKLSRRRFLKLTGAVLASVTVPITATKAAEIKTAAEITEAEKYPGFNPNHQYGNYVTIYDEISKEMLEGAKTLLIKQIRQVIPPEFREGHIEFCNAHFERVSALMPERTEIGWKYGPEITKNKKMRVFTMGHSQPLTEGMTPNVQTLEKVDFSIS